jgi:RNA polymerase sigma-54 factor
MIEDEDYAQAFDRDQNRQNLEQGGVKMSRRTVAKYRDQMHIPGSRERKNRYLIWI